MIAKLTGTVDSLGADAAVLDVGGVGYLVQCSRRTLDRLGRVGAAASLQVETRMREDAITLYGFADAAERDWFRLLTNVQGVGGRTALAILGVLTADQLTVAVATQDKAALTRADGVGPKLAGRIVAELKDKVGLVGGGAEAGLPAPAALAGAVPPGAVADAVSALIHLGYGRSDAFTAVMSAAGKLGDATPLERLVPAALRELAAP